MNTTIKQDLRILARLHRCGMHCAMAEKVRQIETKYRKIRRLSNAPLNDGKQ